MTTSASPIRIVAVDVQRHQVTLSNQRKVGFVTARKVYGLDPEDFLFCEKKNLLLKKYGLDPLREAPPVAPVAPVRLHKLVGGLLVDVDPQTRVATPAECPWTVRVPSDNPEPDCEADCWTHRACGARIFALPGFDETGAFCCEAGHDCSHIRLAFCCEAGHDYLGLEAELDPYGREYQREQEDRNGWDRF